VSGWLLPLVAAGFWAGILLRAPLVPAVRGLPGLLSGVLALVVAASLASPGAGRPEPGDRGARGRSARAPPIAAALVALLGFVVLGATWGNLREQRIRTAPLVRLAPAAVEVTGALDTDPVPGPFGWTAQLGVARARVVSAPAAGAGAAGAADAALRPRERVWLESDGPLPSARRGDRLLVRGRLRLPDGEFGVTLLHHGIGVLLEGDEVRRLGGSSNPLVAAAQVVRDALRRQVQGLFGGREAGLMMGLALGDTSRLDPADAEHFRATGLGHLLAVSGENVAMVLAPVLGLAILLRLTGAARFVLGAFTVLFFVVLTGAEPSVLRAGVMAGLTLFGVLIGRPRSAGTILAAAVLVLLVGDPMLVYAIGFQLSVAATAGIVALAGPIAQRLAGLPRPLALAAATTLAAQAAVTPILLNDFHQVPLVTVLANLLAFPAVAPALLLGLAAAGAGLVSHPLGLLLARLTDLPVHYLQALADHLASAPFPSVTSAGGAGVLVVGLAGVVLLAWWLHSGRRLPRPAVVAGAVALPLFVWSAALSAGPPSHLVVEFLDVGQGDAALVRTPDGATLLIDGGPDPQLVATKLAARGIKRLDMVVATHPHLDHFVGLPAVLARFPVGLVLETPCRPPEVGSPPYRAFLRAVREEGVPERRPRAGAAYTLGALRLDVLGPVECFDGSHSDANNDSLVILLTYGRDTVLFANEPESDAQQALLQANAPVEAEVLNVPHHGADTSWLPFLQAVHERLAVISVGQPNPYGHPDPHLLAELRSTGPAILRTDRCGDVSITFEDRGIRARSARCRELLLESAPP
jgi:competence protein ComEC